MHTNLEADYLIIGAGAMAMAFADEIFSRRKNARFVFVDRRAKPGGHWNDAYPFVTLHQPSAFYGVSSTKLGEGGGALSSRAEIVSYYENIMRRWEKSGRVIFLSKCEYRGDGKVVSLVEPGREWAVTVRERVVDATYMNVEVPATHPPQFKVNAGVNLAPLNALADLKKPFERYCIIGGGKTAIDAVLFLLDTGVDPDRISWIIPSDSWLWNRDMIIPGIVSKAVMELIDSAVSASDVDQIFLNMERNGSLFRLDENVLPDKWRCATVASREMPLLRSVKDVIRKGRVKSISKTRITLEKGSVKTNAKTLHVNCSANGLSRRAIAPLFEPGRITLQSVFFCQQVFSAAIIAQMEMLKMSDEKRNAICDIIPHPEHKLQWPETLAHTVENLLNLNMHMPVWLRRTRLNFLAHESIPRYLKAAVHARLRLPAARNMAQAMPAPD
ncbi:MAG: NAD(P)/FAD-dependent oxidoreductase [bacterium]|nr:NAD(P)/FAD-dependent oxidoreductase [bacterium]